MAKLIEKSKGINWARKLAGPASYIWERLSDGFQPFQISPTEANRRLSLWKKYVSGGDSNLFQKYCDFEGLNENAITKIINGVQLNESADSPDWCSHLIFFLEFESSLHCSKKEIIWDQVKDLPFIDFWIDKTGVFEAHLQKIFQLDVEIISPCAQSKLIVQPIRLIAKTADRVLYSELAALKSTAQSSFAVEHILYKKIINDLKSQGIYRILEENPILARFIGTTFGHWIKSTSDLFSRLQADRTTIETKFGIARYEKVTDLNLDISDSHRGGQQVVILEFESGKRLVYKPKSLETEILYQEILTQFQAWGLTIELPSPAIINREAYGWVEYIQETECCTELEVEQFYKSIGAQLFFFYLLGGTDLHFENVIACGKHAFIIDMETLIHGRIKYDLDGNVNASTEATNSFFFDSVIRTGLLPRWSFDSNDRPFDESAISGGAILAKEVENYHWIRVNTDLMRPGRSSPHTAEIIWAANRPRLNGALIDPINYSNMVLIGFKSTYELAFDNRQTLRLHPCLTSFQNCQSRLILRHTRTYRSLLHNSLNPISLKDGFYASLPIESLSRALLLEDDVSILKRHPLWPLFQAERLQLSQFDIPIIESTSNSCDLFIDGVPEIKDCLQEPPYQRVENNLDNLSENDLERQLNFIQLSYSTSIALANKPPANYESHGSHGSHGQKEIFSFDSESTRWTAVDLIVQRIVKAAIRGQSGDAWWLSINYQDRAQRWQVQPMLPRLYDGIAGTLIFLAAYAQITQEPEVTAICHGLVKTLREGLNQTSFKRSIFHSGIGVGFGASSIAYALKTSAIILDDHATERFASDFLLSFDDKVIASDHRLDLLGGSAGLIVAASTFVERTPELIELIDKSAKHLMSQRVPTTLGPRMWLHAKDVPPLIGLAHGSSGIALALMHAANITGNSEYADAVAESMQYEDMVFNHRLQGWPDFRLPKNSTGDHPVSGNWCNGSSGLGLARIATARNESDAMVIRNAANLSSAGYIPNQLSHLCCGNLGRAVFISKAAIFLNDEKLGNISNQMFNDLAKQVINNQVDLGWPTSLTIPSFHQGLAGIGYFLLKSTQRGKHLPSCELFS
jgi:type 2 lantibiotic biosynthesis protein LanM